MITVEQYYKQQYNHNLRYPLMPLVQVAPREKDIYFPIEAVYFQGFERKKYGKIYYFLKKLRKCEIL
jgi:hypothetical protein